MTPIFVDLLFGSGSALIGASVAWMFFRCRSQRIICEMAMSKARHAAEVLARLQDLAARMAIDVGEHSSQVEEINEQLSASADHEPGEIVDVVANLIQANEQMREKLATTETRLREQAQQIEIHAAEARTDALTLLANRRAFDDELARRVAELRRHGRAFSLLMADVDHFKRFNDQHGHQAGDEVLRSLARLFRQKMREMDLVARYGGEEFAIILPGTDFAEACQAALRLRQAIDQTRFRYASKDLHVTASLGLAEASVDESEAALVMRADQALYASKQNGRNCVHAHDGEGIRRVEPAAEQPPAVAQPAADAEPAPPPPVTPRKPPEGDKPVDSHPAVEHFHEVSHELPSRTTFCQQVRTRIAEWKRGGPTFSVLLAAVDAADHEDDRLAARLRQTTSLALIRHLVATVREMDSLAQYAPDCLALLLPSATLDDAIRIGERIRESFLVSRELPANQRGPVVRFAAAQVAEHDDTISLLTRAELALDSVRQRGIHRAPSPDGECAVPGVSAFPPTALHA